MPNRCSLMDLTSKSPASVLSMAALALSLTIVPASVARAERVTPPRVPADLEVEDGNKAFLKGHAIGTQNYLCLPSGQGFAWTLFGPQATLFDDQGRQLITHYLSPNPAEAYTPRATWQHSRDTSAVWATLVQPSSDPLFVAPGAIPWLLLQMAGTFDGPTGAAKMAKTSYIHRVNTTGGIAPATGCAMATDVGKRALVPYEADYIFYKAVNDDDDD